MAEPTPPFLKPPDYPPATKGDTVEIYHGREVPDPYRYLEEPDLPATIDWVNSQNALVEEFLNRSGDRLKIRERLRSLWDYPKYSTPWKEGGRYFFYKNEGLQNQAILYMKGDLESEPDAVIDPNTFSEDGSISLHSVEISRNGALAAYAVSTFGSDWQDIRIRDLDAGSDYDEVIKWSRLGGIAWKPDGTGFFYNRFPEPGTVPAEDEHRFNKVYFHRLGTHQSEDRLIYERPDAKEFSFFPSVTEDGEYLTLHVFHASTPKNRFYYRTLESDGDFIRLLEDADSSYRFIESVGTLFYFETDFNAPKGRVIAIDIRNPGREHWKEVIAESEDPIEFVHMAGDRFVIAYLKDARSVLKIHTLEGSHARDMDLPGVGTVSALWGRKDDRELFFSFTSYLFPSTIYRYDLAAGQLSLFHGTEFRFDFSPYETVQVFYTSGDGTRVPMFVTHRHGLVRDGTHPALLYGYGGFYQNITPFFSIPLALWLEAGGVYAVANIRGGAEYGEEWHRAAMREKKQHSFDDFIAAAEWLRDKGYTQSARLAIQGGSNGGLLVAACMLQRPDLFGAVICDVPLTDMLRFHRFTIGYYWVEEYGNADESLQEFEYLHAYSPLHNVKEGARYPPTLILTADHDDRVVSGHAKKFAATLQAKSGEHSIILLKVRTKTGHGAGKPTSVVIEEQGDIYAFLSQVLGMSLQ